MNMKLTGIIIKHGDIERIESRTVIYKDGTTIPLDAQEIQELLTAFAIYGVGQNIPVKA